MDIPLHTDGRIDIGALNAQIDWSRASAFESALLTYQHINWEGIAQELRETPELARLAWKENETLLCIATHDNQVDIVRLLLNCGADVNQRCPTGTPIWGAVWSGNPTIVNTLLCRGVEATINVPCEHGWTPLHLAARKGHEDIVQQLLEADAKVNPIDADGYTPLDQAAQMHRAGVAKLLLAKDANYLIPGSKGFVDSLNFPDNNN